ncbi:MAG: carboxylating nicotinate-nucleotide diphosphorylase [Cyclobacteriaceae bacterium]|nr:carboxylating nicotinate-nucleotide diphosphorylase [Cyclobacteriaceae bacterium]
MKPIYITDNFLQSFIETSLREDLGEGDHSTLASIPEAEMGQAKLLVKDKGIIAGVDLAIEIFKQFDRSLKVEVSLQDGVSAVEGDIAFVVTGSIRSILATERLVLNCMQRMSGIATRTNQLVKLVEGTGVQLLDTRKTTPNFRLIEKWAVLIGGGQNHRLGLYDMIMLKDNHIDKAGDIEQAINRTKEYLRTTKKNLKIEVETRSIAEVNEVLKAGGVDVIMLDNMTVPMMKEAVKVIAGSCKTEASGGITEKTIREVAECGVDYISVGMLTHSVRSLDLSLKVF